LDKKRKKEKIRKKERKKVLTGAVFSMQYRVSQNKLLENVLL
jgi:hypothetical protein